MENNPDNTQAEVEENVHGLREVLTRSSLDKRPIAVMMCCIAGEWTSSRRREFWGLHYSHIGEGAGKSTYAKTMVRLFPTFQRISIDQILADRRGIVGVDYPMTKYEAYQEDADIEFVGALQEILDSGDHDIVIDRSFYSKEDREKYRRMIDDRGGRSVLLHLRAPKDELWRRICARRKAKINADSALGISQELLDHYYVTFEWPEGENEITIDTVRT